MEVANHNSYHIITFVFSWSAEPFHRVLNLSSHLLSQLLTHLSLPVLNFECHQIILHSKYVEESWVALNDLKQVHSFF